MKRSLKTALLIAVLCCNSVTLSVPNQQRQPRTDQALRIGLAIMDSIAIMTGL